MGSWLKGQSSCTLAQYALDKGERMVGPLTIELAWRVLRLVAEKENGMRDHRSLTDRELCRQVYSGGDELYGSLVQDLATRLEASLDWSELLQERLNQQKKWWEWWP